MEFTNEELDIIGWGIKQLIKDKQYCVDDEEKGKLMDLCKKVGFKKKINNLIDCETTRVEIEVEDRKREIERKKEVKKEELEKLKEEVKRRDYGNKNDDEEIQKPVRTYRKGKKYKTSYTEITKTPNEKTIRSYFKELNKEQIEEVEKSIKSRGKCMEIEKRICPYEKTYFIVFKWDLMDEIGGRVIWFNDYSLKWKKCSKYNDFEEFKHIYKKL